MYVYVVCMYMYVVCMYVCTYIVLHVHTYIVVLPVLIGERCNVGGWNGSGIGE